jgi:polyisoprenoid-binding protein YceI
MILIKHWCFLGLFFYSIGYAESLPQWEIIPDESSIRFTGTQNNSPVTGEFKSFSGTIFADPSKYQNSRVQIIVQMNSLAVNYSELASMLANSEWFNIKKFPIAEFKASKFSKIDEKTYQAMGEFIIKNKSVPTTVTFTATKSPKNHITVEGNTPIKRSAFNVGEGEWASTDVIKDEVTIHFKIVAKPKGIPRK